MTTLIHRTALVDGEPVHEVASWLLTHDGDPAGVKIKGHPGTWVLVSVSNPLADLSEFAGPPPTFDEWGTPSLPAKAVAPRPIPLYDLPLLPGVELTEAADYHAEMARREAI